MSTRPVCGPGFPALLTPAEVKQTFVAKGETISTWAKAHGFSREEVYAVLNGRSKGRHGRAHRIAVLLGIKADPSSQEVSRPPGVDEVVLAAGNAERNSQA